MYAIPISDTEAVAVDDSDDDEWQVYFIDYPARTMDGFRVTGLDRITCGFYDKYRNMLWLVIEGAIFAIDVEEKELMEVPMPDDSIFVYDINEVDNEIIISGDYTNIWKCTAPDLDWIPLMTPEPKSARSSDEDIQSRLNCEYVRKHPPLYKAFKKGNDLYFCGAIGTLVRYRNGVLERTQIETGARLVTGHAEGSRIVLSADSPAAEIYAGDFDAGFERIFTDDLRAMNLTALHKGRRFIGVAEYPPSDVHNLYTYDDEEVVPHETGCMREPSPLIALASTGSVLWAIDVLGIFRLEDGVWTLLDIDDLRSGVWPEGG